MDKATFLSDIQNKIRELDNKIDTMRERAESDKVQDLRRERNNLQNEIDSVQHDDNNNWEEFKDRIEHNWNELKHRADNTFN